MKFFLDSHGLRQFCVTSVRDPCYDKKERGGDKEMKEHIYIAEDEKEIREMVKTFLMSEGYEVSDFSTGDALFEKFLQNEPDLVILDVLMPGSSGFDITKKIRERSAVPIIILTARDSDLDYATGINLGSDDYFTKPFSAISLVMRVKAMLRRVRLDQENPKGKEEESLSFASLTINPGTMEVLLEGKVLELTPTEFRLLSYLIKNSDRAVSRTELLDEVWGYSIEVETRACDDTVRRLRKKLSASQIRIDNIWGFGFRIMEEES